MIYDVGLSNSISIVDVKPMFDYIIDNDLAIHENRKVAKTSRNRQVTEASPRLYRNKSEEQQLKAIKRRRKAEQREAVEREDEVRADNDRVTPDLMMNEAAPTIEPTHNVANYVATVVATPLVTSAPNAQSKGEHDCLNMWITYRCSSQA